jgi:hypothetical protein
MPTNRAECVGQGQAVLSDNIADADSATTKFAQKQP